MQKFKAFTLIEVLITIAIVGLLAIVAIPSYRSYALNNTTAAAANDLYASIQYARNQAIIQKTPVSICAITANSDGGINSENGFTCINSTPKNKSGTNGWSAGWIVYTGENNNPDANSDILQINQGYNIDINYSALFNKITFDSSGIGLAFNASSNNSNLVNSPVCLYVRPSASCSENYARNILLNSSLLEIKEKNCLDVINCNN